MNAIELYNDLFALGVLVLIPAFLSWLLWVISLVFGDDFEFGKVMFFALLFTGFALLITSAIVRCTHPEVEVYLQEENKVACECSCGHCGEAPELSAD